MVATARAVATALQDRPGLIDCARLPAEGARAGPRPGNRGNAAAHRPASRAPGSRIWVVDSRLRLVAVAGNLEGAPQPRRGSVTFGPLERVVRAPLRPLFERLHATGPRAVPRNSFRAMWSSAGARWSARSTALRRGAVAPAPGGRAVILSVAHPVWVGDPSWAPSWSRKNTDAIVTLRNRALEQLAAVTLIAFGAGALVLFVFASSLSSRLRKLRDEAENAIDSQGRVRGLVAGEHAPATRSATSRAAFRPCSSASRSTTTISSTSRAGSRTSCARRSRWCARRSTTCGCAGAARRRRLPRRARTRA